MSGLTTGKDGHHLKRRSRRSAVHAVDQERHRRRQTLTRSLLILFLLFALAGLAFLRIAGFERTALEPYRATTNDSKRKGSNKSERMIKEQTKTSKNIKVRNRTKEKDSLSSFLRKGGEKDGGEMLDVSYHGNSKKPFCLDWSINSDDWWTHHPDWEVFNETENSYCFHVISNVEKATLYRSIYVSQFPSRPKSCQKAVSAHMWNSGFGADFDNLVDKLRFAHRKRGVPFVVRTHPDNGWHYAYPKHKPKGKNVRRADPVCDTKDMFCYFLPFTNCTSEESTVPTTTEPFLWQSNFYLWEANQRIYWYFQYLVGRQQTWLRRRIYDFVLFYQAKFDLGSKPCTVFHVRRSDVVLHEDDSRRYHAISEYMNAVDLFRDDKDNRTFPIHKNIFLLTDDANAIDEAKEQYPNHHWMYVDRKRFRADEGGWENQIPSNDPALEIVILLGTFRLIQQCQSFVHTESNLGKLLAAELKHSVDPSFPTLNLDYGKGFDEVFSKDHQSTVHLSTSWKNESEKILPAKDVERISGKTTSTTQKDAKPEGIIEPSPSDTNVEEIVKPLSYVVKKEMRNVTNKGENEFDTFRGYLDVSYRSDGSTKPFCLPWHVNSDKWWTHHPDWRVTKETEDHYCFRHMRDKSEAKFHTDLYNNQFEGNCSNVLVKKMWSSGFGADMMNLMDGLRYGHVSGIPFQVYTEDFGWHYAAPKTAGRLDENVKPADPLCPSKDMFCFFLPISNCPSRKRLDDQYYFEPVSKKESGFTACRLVDASDCLFPV